tara:strand:- start:252 stop:467 length:216 start_codon:yes stop_codon:yes gene_type:complete
MFDDSRAGQESQSIGITPDVPIRTPKPLVLDKHIGAIEEPPKPYNAIQDLDPKKMYVEKKTPQIVTKVADI